MLTKRAASCPWLFSFWISERSFQVSLRMLRKRNANFTLSHFDRVALEVQSQFRSSATRNEEIINCIVLKFKRNLYKSEVSFT